MAISTLSTFGLIDGITALLVVLFGMVFGLYFLYQGKKRNANQLLKLGVISMLAGLMFLGVCLDFLLVVFTDSNIDNSWGAAGLLSYIWFAPLIVLAMYIGSELHLPKNDKAERLILLIYLLLGIVFTVIIFLDPFSAFYFGYPEGYPNDPEALVDYNINLTSIAGLLMAAMLFSVLLFLGVGTLIRGIKLTGDIKKRFILISLGAFCFGIFGILEGLTVPGGVLIFVRIGYLSSFWFLYYGLS